ncbi:DUF1801 domain-containing protein [Paenibacillus sp. LHD-38]|uniref:DUF1801 domain-containing protein n=1 Tax=Paenibacillus sp. LHD-38 TaxID=3072143 RepID=UPI00280E89FC|nr:DUF1801 domain-containing protein [Paenibacillus sp. LHD-38]MDQ8738104.1 DUF1801 domain-containing protein [Paenibacillus sp. LHD-38]
MNRTSNKAKSTMTGEQQVADFMQKLEHPQKQEIAAVRTIILSADQQLHEHIKWNAPSFCVDNEDRITFNLRGKGYFMLVFHCGAKVRERNGEGPFIDDTSGLLEWAAHDRATLKFTNMADVEDKRDRLTEIIRKWLAAASSE